VRDLPTSASHPRARVAKLADALIALISRGPRRRQPIGTQRQLPSTATPIVCGQSAGPEAVILDNGEVRPVARRDVPGRAGRVRGGGADGAQGFEKRRDDAPESVAYRQVESAAPRWWSGAAARFRPKEAAFVSIRRRIRPRASRSAVNA